jgi:hypothetical protein
MPGGCCWFCFGVFDEIPGDEMSAAPSPYRGGVSNKTVYVLLGVAAVIFVLCGGGLLGLAAMRFMKDEPPVYEGGGARKSRGTIPSPEDSSGLNEDKVRDFFFEELKENKVEDAYGRTSTGFQGRNSMQSFVTLLSKNKGFIGHTSLRMKSIPPSRPGGKAYKGHVGGGEGTGVDFTIELGQEDQGWRVTQFTIP